MFGSKRANWREAGEDCIMRSFITCKLLQASRRMRLVGRVARTGEMIYSGSNCETNYNLLMPFSYILAFV
jgi:hypothetical protein